jgi:hypothetical protein
MIDFNPLTTISAAPAPGRPKSQPAEVCRGEEPVYGQPDFELGQIGSEMRAKLSRLKVEEKFTSDTDLEFLGKYVGALAAAPDSAILTGQVLAPEDLYRQHPELKTIQGLDDKYHKSGCRHAHLFFYFRNNEYWNNAVVLLSVLAQKYVEINDKAGIQKTIDYCRQFAARIERQHSADRTFEPVAYYRAVLALTESELKAQVKGKALEEQVLGDLKRAGTDPAKLTGDKLHAQLITAKRDYYLQARTAAFGSIQTLLATKDKFYWPSEPDFFSIPKALIVLGDLNIKIKELDREEIAFLRRQPGKNGARINQLEQESITLTKNAFTLYDAMEKIREDQETKISIDRETVGLPPGQPFEFTTSDIKNALAKNQQSGFLDEVQRLEALKGIFHYLKAVTMLKKAALVPQLLSFDPKDYPPALKIRFSTPADKQAYVQETLQRIGTSATEARHDGKDINKVRLAEPDTIFSELARGAKKSNDFFFAFATIIRADLLLTCSDLMKYPLSLPGERNKLKESDNYARRAQLLYEDKSLYLNNAKKTDHPFEYLYAWSVVKLAEIAIRFTDHLDKQTFYLGRLGAVASQLEEGEYLHVEYNNLMAVLYISRCLAGKRDKADDRVTAGNFTGRLEREADFLELPQRMYFRTWGALKAAESLSRQGKWAEAAKRFESIEHNLNDLLVYKERLSWRPESFYAELYFEWAIALLSQGLDAKGRPYLSRALDKAKASDNVYDYGLRVQWIERGLGMKNISFKSVGDPVQILNNAIKQLQRMNLSLPVK